MRLLRRGPERDPWEDAPVGELGEPLLPRWFVLLALAAVPVALGVFVLALVGTSPPDLGVAERRPPPGAGLTSVVGELLVGETEPEGYDAPCAHLAGVRLAGTQADQQLLRNAVAGLCNVPLDDDATEALAAFATRGGIVRFAVFELTGVDSTATLDDPPMILVNARFAQVGRPRWIAPLIAHDAVVLAGEPGGADTALRARQVEDQVCTRLLGSETPPQGCTDAAELLVLDDPLNALREAGYR